MNVGLKVWNNMKNLSCILLSPAPVSTIAKFTKCHMRQNKMFCLVKNDFDKNTL